MRKPTFPRVAKGVVTIYRIPEGKYNGYTLAWREGDRRRRRKFADYAKPKKEANSIVDKINHGEKCGVVLNER